MFTEVQQKNLLTEGQQWYDQLVALRDKLNLFKTELYQFAPGKTDKDVLMGIEHFHNQFHIQLINVHDFKHELRHHIQELEHLAVANHNTTHLKFKHNLDALLKDLQELEVDFHRFIGKE
ncbi:MAG: hypothetical protein JNM44_09865 [Chitinophagaceae bacterium]|nr:hypothetical protein [Chitinophagaceae bacterium]